MASDRLQERWELLAERLGRRYAGCRVSNYHAPTEAHRATVASVTEYIGDLVGRVKQGQSVWFYGPPGTGKDHLMVAMMRAAINAGALVKWDTGAEMMGRFRDAIKGSETEGKMMDRYTDPVILAISDPVPPIGGLTPYQSGMLSRIIDRRYRDMRPTWVTINVKDRSEAEERMGTNIVDRLGHDALAIPCNWESYRRSHGG